jgi:hypothetical protein
MVAGCSGASSGYFGDAGGGSGDGESTDDGALADAGGVRADGGKGRADARADGHASGEGGDDDDGEGVDATPPGPTKVGRILLGQTITLISGQEYDSSYATAMFMETDPAGGSSCATSHFGACDVYDCPLGGPTPDAGAVRYAGAGTVDVTGGFTNYSLPTSGGTYTTESSQELLYDEGTVLYASASGDEVPAFSNRALTVPGPFTVENPSLDGSLALPRTQGLALAWSGASGQKVQVNVSTVDANVRSVAIACTFTGSSGTVPAGAMGKLLPTSGAVTGYVSVSSPVETTFAAGAWQITFALNGAPAATTFTTTN